MFKQSPPATNTLSDSCVASRAFSKLVNTEISFFEDERSGVFLDTQKIFLSFRCGSLSIVFLPSIIVDPMVFSEKICSSSLQRHGSSPFSPIPFAESVAMMMSNLRIFVFEEVSLSKKSNLYKMNVCYDK